MNQLLSSTTTLDTLIADHAAETVFWLLVAVGAVWFLWTCWRTVKKQ